MKRAIIIAALALGGCHDAPPPPKVRPVVLNLIPPPGAPPASGKLLTIITKDTASWDIRTGPLTQDTNDRWTMPVLLKPKSPGPKAYVEFHCVFYAADGGLAGQAWTNWSSQDIAVPNTGELNVKMSSDPSTGDCWLSR